MAIVRVFTGGDGRSHFEDVEPDFKPRTDGWPQDADAAIPGVSGVVVRRFDAARFNAWHHAPGRYAVFNLTGAVEIEVGDGTKRTLRPGDVLIAEDLTGQGHYTREVGDEPRVSMFVPLV